jgi:uroporphyrinogen-III decarboxylase
MKILPLSCHGGKRSFPFGDFLVSLGLESSALYDDPSVIAMLARKFRIRGRQSFCILPLCQTTESAAMGADIIPANRAVGPHPGKYVLSGIEELKEVILAAHPSIRCLLTAISMLKNECESVVYEICGPVSIMSCMMDLSVLFRQWMKEPDLALMVLDRIKTMLLDLLSEVCKAGAECIAYADPAANIEILGPKHGIWLVEHFTKPFLCDSMRICAEHQVSLLLCPSVAEVLHAAGVLLQANGADARFAVGCVSAMKRIPNVSYTISFVENEK